MLFKASLPYNPIPISKKLKSYVNTFIPEGWAFFTRNPREPSLYLYKKTEEGNAVPYCTYPSATADHWFGAKRTLRSQGAEAGTLIKGIPESSWIEHEGRASTYIEECGDFLQVAILDNPVAGPYLCGSVYIVLQEPVPWACARSANNLNHHMRIAKMNVSCE